LYLLGATDEVRLGLFKGKKNDGFGRTKAQVAQLGSDYKEP